MELWINLKQIQIIHDNMKEERCHYHKFPWFAIWYNPFPPNESFSYRVHIIDWRLFSSMYVKLNTILCILISNKNWFQGIIFMRILFFIILSNFKNSSCAGILFMQFLIP